MRRKDREIKDISAIEDIIRATQVVRLGLSDGDQPYVVPLSFGYRDQTLFFHCAPKGYKLDIIRRNPKVCVEFDIDSEVITAREAVKWSMAYRSVIGFGTAKIIPDSDLTAKIEALDCIMAQYSDKSWDYPENIVEKITLVRVDILSMTGKNHIKE